MMLSEYILQMHTTPVACNSVSGAPCDGGRQVSLSVTRCQQVDATRYGTLV
jgi:hypothetical protein